ncbi:hypothetical protein PILCRDRAFT_89253 [Piloderma croceum F 1598]|uniref:Uncharacterized protein n=1 Tax=Piloderma croceum (strain F 1598) TaxID=765440 RepID=A0A0C3B4Z6_PILCF|nr:hypothetical protein PILCRDRAFT_89253 [Piloderma croceum F 1598]
MGYNSDEESDVLMTYQFSDAPKSTCDALENDDDYQSIITALQAHCANSALLTVEIHDANSKAEPESSKKQSQKEFKIAKAKATAAAQSETDKVVSELEMLHPPWPTLDDFLCGIQEQDKHKRDLTIHKVALGEQEILGPDDIAKCLADKLHDRCNIHIASISEKALNIIGRNGIEAFKKKYVWMSWAQNTIHCYLALPIVPMDPLLQLMEHLLNWLIVGITLLVPGKGFIWLSKPLIN